MRATALSILTICTIAISVIYYKQSIDLYLMGFFRDLSRLKARKRLMERKGMTLVGTSTKDMKMLFLKIEDADPLPSFSFRDADGENRIDLPVYSREELYEFGNGQDGKPTLISLFGRVYDVSSGKKFYGPGGKYHSFAGRDITKALSSGCLVEKCLGSTTSNFNAGYDRNFNFTDNEMAEGKKWLAFFETHDSYSHVGMLNEDQTVEQLIHGMVEMDS
mmetsp:Transcript_23953/g.28265  ORF Transcript_23953/g.28265 Transcript_23953/m.28265 type:complete len:219 (+) Transcript_23953:64-720(+)